MAKTTRYRLIAAIGDALPGEAIDLTDEQAESPLYASRIAPNLSGEEGGPSEAELREKILAELESKVPAFLSDAQDKADQLLADARAEAEKLVEAAKVEAKQIVETAQAEAMKLATAKK